jgi:hypothetical protein
LLVLQQARSSVSQRREYIACGERWGETLDLEGWKRRTGAEAPCFWRSFRRAEALRSLRRTKQRRLQGQVSLALSQEGESGAALVTLKLYAPPKSGDVLP